MINVDALELQKFSALAQQWWDPRGPMRPLHLINPLRTEWINRHAQLRGKRTLDVGCGGGILSESMHECGAHVTGIDLANTSLDVAREHAMRNGHTIQYLHSTAEALAQTQPAAFDVVVCMEVLEHVPEPAHTITACAELTKPGGWCFFSTINRNVKAFALAIVAAEYLLGLVPKGTHEYTKFIRPSELARYAREAGLDIIELKGLRLNPLTQSATLSNDTDINYLLACHKPQAT